MQLIYYGDILQHHGVKGMKWGVRRYQNADGSLTAAGQKRYSNMSDEKLFKTLSKQTNKMTRNGKNTKQALQKRLDEHNKVLSNDEKLQKAIKEMKALQKKYGDDGLWPKSAVDKYDAAANIVERSMADFGYVQYSFEKGKGFTEEYINGWGKNISIAKLKDAGYNEATAKSFVERLAKSNITLG